MKQKLLSFLTLITFAIGQLYAYDFSAANSDGVIICYNIIENGVEVTWNPNINNGNQNSYRDNVVIPSTVNYDNTDYSVTAIGNSAFVLCEGLTSVSIPNSVTAIGDGAFYGCSNLATFYGKYSSDDNQCLIIDGDLIAFAPAGIRDYTIPNSASAIGNGAFAGCGGLTSVSIPNSVTAIGDGAFSGCGNLAAFYGKYSSDDNRCLIIDGNLIAFAPADVTDYIIPNSVTAIGNEAFAGCAGLTSISIPNSVTAIGNSAFAGCAGLTSISIPNSVTAIGNSAFAGCAGLTSVSIPNSVTSIGNEAFNGCSGLTSVSIPNSVTAIGDEAFANCSRLTSIAIPNSVTAIGNSAFVGCSGLTSISIPNSVTAIGDRAFADCRGLTSVSIPNSVTSIGNEAFYNCGGLTSVTIPNSVTTIGNSAFAYCSGLTSVSIPNSVTAIGDYAFAYCSGLTSVSIPNSVTSIGNSAFVGCSGLTSVSIPNSVTSIGNLAFYGCSGLTAFYGKYSSDDNRCLIIDGDLIAFAPADVTDYTIPNSVTTIGNSAFVGCSGLTSVSIPNSVTAIGDAAFAGCGLQYIKVEWPSPEDIVLGSDIFNGVDTQNCALFVPDGTIDLYAVTEPWSGFVIKEGEPAISEMLPEDVYARIEGIYTCNGDGETFNLGISIYPEDDENYLKKVIIYGWKGYEWAQIECDFSFNAFIGVPNLSIPVGTPVALNVNFGDIGVCNVYVMGYSSEFVSLGGTINVAGNEDVSVFTFQNGIAGGLFNGSATYSSYMGRVLFRYQTLTMSKQLGSIDEVDAPDTNDITITTNGGELQIHNTLSGEPVALYTLMGQMLYSGVTTDAVTTVPVNLSKGTICILRVGAHPAK